MEYTNSIVVIIGAAPSQMKEATPYIDNAAVVLLHSDPGDLKPTKLSTADFAAYDPEIVNRLREYREQIGMLLYWWWLPHKREDAWAAQIVQEARASFGKPDSRYVSVELDPKLLRDRIRYLVFLEFLNELGDYGYMSHEDLEPYRQTAKEVFDPEPPEPVVIRRAEDPEVFLDIMRALAIEKASSIVAEGERFDPAATRFAGNFAIRPS